MRFRITYILAQISIFCGTSLGRFSQCFFLFLLSTPTMKKLPVALYYKSHSSQTSFDMKKQGTVLRKIKKSQKQDLNR